MNWIVLSLILMGTFSAVQAQKLISKNWSLWEPCDRTCGVGTRRRYRCVRRISLICREQRFSCTNPPCFRNKPNFERGPWEQWSTCTASCGGGFRERTRHCDDISICSQKQSGNCNNQVCEQDAFATTTPSPAPNWSTWTKCSQTCGKGVERRTRTCVRNRVCRGRNTQERDCSVQKCPPELSNWGGWSTCSATCDDGLERRTRKCQGGQGCEGDNRQNRKCLSIRCPPEWTDWTKWSACSVTCGGGEQTRTRKCEGGRGCGGTDVQEKKCAISNCPTIWSKWGEWSRCTATCGNRKRKRARACGNGEKTCIGRRFQAKACSQRECKKDKWSDWGKWGKCSSTCSDGTQQRNRNCNGTACNGEPTESQSCNTQTCSTRCSLIRAPLYGMIENERKVYVTNNTINIKCYTGFFLKDGSEKLTCLNTGKWSAEPAQCAARWREWSSWSNCSTSCGGGTRQRRRVCSAIAPFFCTGAPAETSKCNEKKCATLELKACGKAGNIGNIFNRKPVGARVIAGTDAAEGAWPWQALIISNSDYDVKNSFKAIKGGGSLLNQKWMLTAAHVFQKFSLRFKTKIWTRTVLFVLGLTQHTVESDLPNDAHVFEPELVIRHPKYNRRKTFFDYDVAMVKVGQKLIALRGKLVQKKVNGIIPFSMKIRPVCLPCISDLTTGDSATGDLIKKFDEKTCSIDDIFTMRKENESANAVITGYGKTNRRDSSGREIIGILQQGLLRLADNDTCYEAVQKIKVNIKNAIYTPRMICTLSGRKQIQVDACSGDSGGPLVKRITNPDGSTRWVQIGIVSWGLGCATSDHNGIEYPGFFVNLKEVMSFIVQSMKDNAL